MTRIMPPGMKAVILAGGLGTRMREETEFRPKPMVDLGGRPIIHHIMSIYSHWGIKDFVVLAGYKGDIIRDYFLNYSTRAEDFTVNLSQRDSIRVESSGKGGPDWNVTVVETGPLTETGARLLKAKRFLESESFFLTYGDGVADIDISALWSSHVRSGRTATMSLATVPSRFGHARLGEEDEVISFVEKPIVSEPINIGFYAMNPGVFNYLDELSALEKEPIARLIENRQLSGYVHDGFWQAMDTQREVIQMTKLIEAGRAPWMFDAS
jgi:glucose-1-phosphate cytidylyltransferase